MFKKLFSKPLILEIEGKELTFSSLDDFEFALSSRTEVPLTRLMDSLKLSDAELKREAEGIKQVEKYFVDVLSRTMEDETTIGQHFRAMDHKLFSQDHQWRSIIQAINKKEPEYDEFKRHALVKYIQYLTSRQEVVQSIYSERQKQGGQGLDSASGQEGSPGADLKETVIFDLTQVQPAAQAKKVPAMARMPKGEAIEIPLGTGEPVAITLSKHPFHLVPGEQCFLVDDNGSDYLLRIGKNVIGRDVEGDVVANASYRDVSRRHLIIELVKDGPAYLTDLSSHGTYIPAIYLDSTLGVN